jgi:hypothetical protein
MAVCCTASYAKSDDNWTMTVTQTHNHIVFLNKQLSLTYNSHTKCQMVVLDYDSEPNKYYAQINRYSSLTTPVCQ